MTGILVLRGAYYGAQWGGLVSLAVSTLARYCWSIHSGVLLVLPVAGGGGEIQSLYLWPLLALSQGMSTEKDI